MERLTERTKYGIVGNNNGVENFPLYSLYDETHLDHGLIEQCFNKLAEYEDLEEQIMKKFAGCIDMKTILDSFCAFYDMQETNEDLAQCTLLTNEDVLKYRQWKEAEEQGLLLRLPCKVGDVVYQITRDFISEFKIKTFVCDGKSFFFYWQCIKGIYVNVIGFHSSRIGKDVFLTKEEAEQALAEKYKT